MTPEHMKACAMMRQAVDDYATAGMKAQTEVAQRLSQCRAAVEEMAAEASPEQLRAMSEFLDSMQTVFDLQVHQMRTKAEEMSFALTRSADRAPGLAGRIARKEVSRFKRLSRSNMQGLDRHLEAFRRLRSSVASQLASAA